MLLHETFAFTIRGKILKSHTKISFSKYQLQNGIKSLNYIVDHFLYQIFKKKHKTITDNPSIIIHVNKIEYGITFKIKKGS